MKSTFNLKKALVLRRQGATLAQIAKRLGVTAGTVSRHLQKAEAGGERLPRRKAGRPRKGQGRKDFAKGEAAPAPADPLEHADELAELRDRMAALGGDGIAAIEAMRREYLPHVRRHARAALASGNAIACKDWLRLEADLAERLVAATPPPPPDPDLDPANIEVRDRVLATLERIGNQRMGRLCADCKQRLGHGGAPAHG